MLEARCDASRILLGVKMVVKLQRAHRGRHPEHLFVVGAGFSANAGLPLTAQFTQELLNTRHLRADGPSSLIIEFLRKFVEDTFGLDAATPPESWPQLEDIFTSVDLSANSGHYLGRGYSPADLRTVRRALLTRIIRMLYQTHGRGERRRDSNWLALEKFFSLISLENSAFLSMNWDTVIEEGLQEEFDADDFDYGCDALRVSLSKSNARIVGAAKGRRVTLLKPHGSANWLYCDLCRRMFWVPPDYTEYVAKQLFGQRDWEVVSRHIGRGSSSKTSAINCPSCDAHSLGTRFAAFSYRKALDFPMHMRSWLKAETLLQTAKTWTFIGYSLPAADYEFKHLLKQVQLARMAPPRITLVTGGAGAEATVENYRRFLGSQMSAFKDGLSEVVFHHLADVGALRR